MWIEETDVLIVGAGQAGLAMSEHLGAQDIPHIVLERHRIGERWRSERWDSLVANGPVWHDRFPTMEFTDIDPDCFATKEQIVEYSVAYSEKIDSPVRCGVEVISVTKEAGTQHFRAETSAGEVRAKYIVAATGPFQNPAIPALVPDTESFLQIHSSAYRNPSALPPGAVVVVGAGSSGVQIADELQASGRQVYLAVGPHDRPPRSYRGRDFVWWLGVLGKWDASATSPDAEHVTIAVTGKNGGHTVDFRDLANSGIQLVGRASHFEDGVLHFSRDLAANITNGDANYLSLLDEADAFVTRNGLNLPEEPSARTIQESPPCVTDPITALNLSQENVTSIIWATGFGVDFSWLKVSTFDDFGKPLHQRGVSQEPGVYFLGLPWLSRRGSSFLWGCWYDAKYLADQIQIQRGYRSYPLSRHSLPSPAQVL